MLHTSKRTAVGDVFSAGIILLCIMSGRFPFFYAKTETQAVMEYAALFGTERLKQAAQNLGTCVT